MAYKNIEKRREWFKHRYQVNCQWMQSYKIQQGCKDCGYNAHHAGLEFDHIGDDKRNEVSRLAGSSLRIIKEEIAKCEVVCGTCHNIRTWQRNHG